MISLFFSYSHRDETLRDELEIHLSMLKRQRAITTWHDRRIGAGTEFEGEISEHLEKADIVLLLVSPDFLASDYCYAVEMTRALERHESREARVIPVILRPCDWRSAPFGKLLAVPEDGKPVAKYANQDDAFLEVVKAIRDAAGQIQHTSNLEQPPPPATASVGTVSPGVRSSNLRIRKSFSDEDRDRFAEESFEFIAKFFEGSLSELERRNSEVSTKFKRIDANHFTSAMYVSGSLESQCKIWLASESSFTGNILFSSDMSRGDNSWNESLSIEDDGHALFLKPMGMASLRSERDELLSQEGAAECFWEILIRPLRQ